MYYHPLIGILIFLISVLIAFFMGRSYINSRNMRNNTINNLSSKKDSVLPPKGDITSPDAPWLKDK